jgi:hypothetical protein
MAVSILLPLASAALLLLPLAGVVNAAPGCCREPGHAGDQSAHAEFMDHVNQYVELHLALAAPLGPEAMCFDPEQLQSSADLLAAAIRDARTTARTGDIFTPRVADLLRHTIADAAYQTGYAPALLDETSEEGQPVVTWLEVNGPFPWRAGHELPPMMLRRLPVLPGELEYRLVARDLVLLDVRANLVVDLLENALTVSGQPCDVHPEMPACWM